MTIPAEPTELRVVAGIYQRDGKVLLSQRGPKQNFALQWEFPGGKLEAKESPVDALKREWAEELAVDIRRCEYRFTICHPNPQRAVRIAVYDILTVENDSALQFSPQETAVGHEGQALRYLTKPELLSYPVIAADRPILLSLIVPRLRRVGNLQEILRHGNKAAWLMDDCVQLPQAVIDIPELLVFIVEARGRIYLHPALRANWKTLRDGLLISGDNLGVNGLEVKSQEVCQAIDFRVRTMPMLQPDPIMDGVWDCLLQD